MCLTGVAYFSPLGHQPGWTKGGPFANPLRCLLFGQGGVAPATHEVLSRAEPDLKRRPRVHVG
ncbi:hypothetical protein ABTX62_33440 [Streptomyces sp. NPDC096046]|uniref:hypothetical protein n=1 Tax=Streptomyces sp. NPDC096046 TaxID=3155542 RepID=UPI003329C96E